MEFYPFLFAAFHFMLLLFPSTSLMHSNFTDLSSLLAFKARVRDPHNILTTNWTTDASFCTWTGVSCSHRRQRVVSLRLTGVSLHGTIAPEVANMSFLSYLNLQNNSLVGPIPASLLRLPRLKVLNLQRNQLSDSTPPAIFNMSLLTHLLLGGNYLYGDLPSNFSFPSFIPRLQVLSLSYNQLSGNIPSSLFHCYHLQKLSLSYNQFTGTIPMEIGNLKLLTILYLGANNLTGSIPASLGNLTNLLELDSGQNYLSGVIPEELGGLLNLQELNLLKNQLSGNIPSSLSYCHHLRKLSLSFNQFSGNIPLELGNLKQLAILYLGANNLTGSIPASLGNLTNLLELDIAKNNIYGVIPEELGGLLNLQLVMLSWNHAMTGPIPLSFSNMSSLTVIELAYCKLTGPVHASFGNMPRLKILNLGGNKLTGGLHFLGSLSSCKVLQRLGLWENELDGFLPNNIGNLSRNLLIFSVDANHIKGTIPSALGNLTSLSIIDLGENELVGTIPSEITMLENMQWLSLDDNMLHGFIPHELGRLRLLNGVFFYANSLSGSIPDSIGNISALERLVLSTNALSSGIPESMGNLTRLLGLDLSHNSLDGSLSSWVGNMKSLDVLDVSMNQFSGEIPSGLKGLQMLRYLDLSNNSFYGSIPQWFGELISIEVLNLSCNNLTGVIPNSLANPRYLSSINLSFNKLEGEIPNCGAFLNLTASSLVGNAALCGAPRLGFPQCPTYIAVSSKGRWLHLLKYILPPLAFTTILTACLFRLWKPHWKRTKSSDPVSTPPPNQHRMISYYELIRATGNFSEANLLGRGSFGSVYKGCLDDGLLTAIKVLNLGVDGASRSFDVECRALRMVRHRNLVKTISICSNLDFRALVLQFMPNGSLDRWLYSHNHCLNLLQRINILIDVASALEYLHHDHSHVVLHCDLKPSNILLDEDMTARVSDFGIAKLMVGDSQSLTSASALGTIGYMAPEYASIGRVSTKGDVYSFGILLLEIFTRKKPTDPMFVGELNLRRWVYVAYPSALLDVVDCNLLKDDAGNQRPSECLISMHACLSSIMELGMICSSDSPKERFAMKDVVPKLHKIKTDFLSMFPTA